MACQPLVFRPHSRQTTPPTFVLAAQSSSVSPYRERRSECPTKTYLEVRHKTKKINRWFVDFLFIKGFWFGPFCVGINTRMWKILKQKLDLFNKMRCMHVYVGIDMCINDVQRLKKKHRYMHALMHWAHAYLDWHFTHNSQAWPENWTPVRLKENTWKIQWKGPPPLFS